LEIRNIEIRQQKTLTVNEIQETKGYITKERGRIRPATKLR